ncbi:atypical/ABC1/ABC1-B protein kinase [Macrolepiota fuliginosa MF-IS2]|uniref:Atypical/ABC1/ABC1-B protein kinase n=1 Tax=Macrolepiota fuliginosa MF-IS2 TaxID=1400762 RepID=A0A9P5XBY7_9AGAR|nr:atypical/ABC1/ABC1-B protein kinase [Macrolepiota fuliginosa MF-IS2]
MVLHRTYLVGWRRLQRNSTSTVFSVANGHQTRWFRNPPRLHQIPRHHTHKTYVNERPWIYSAAALLVGGAGYIAYQNYQPFRHTCLAAIRCSRVAGAAIIGAIDYKLTFTRHYDTENQYADAVSQCHKRSAERVLRALLANGGIFIKLGQHMASLIVLPREWTGTMRPLQDQCEPTPYEDIEKLFESDMGASIDELFDDFDPNPIGIASLAQVHIGTHKPSGRRVAVKLQHPHLAEFCDIDMEMVEVTLGWIKYWFPEFEFTWLADEMRQNLPKEMDFIREDNNAARATKDFEGMRTSLYIPEVIISTKRVLIMEFIEGGRVDDLQYLAKNNIDRNKVALELSRIFSQMVFVNGWFHADPHPGNLLIRPAIRHSHSPYNFEIVLLDHGLYFDLGDQLRVNYGRFWLSLIASSSPSVQADRRKYAELVGNIGPDLYPVFEAAITGRAAMEGSWDDAGDVAFKRASGLIDMTPQTEEEMEAIRNAVVAQDGLIISVFDVLRRVPRRVLMVLKLNDLTRSLDNALATTHSNIRIFLITAKYCAFAVWEDERKQAADSIRTRGLLSLSLFRDYFGAWWKYESSYLKFLLIESFLDLQAASVKVKAWFKGLRQRGLAGAREAAAGLTIV